MLKRMTLMLLTAFGLALSSLVAGCGDGTDVGEHETGGAAILADHVGIDLGSPGLPIVPEKVVVADPVKSFLSPTALPLYEKEIERPLSSKSMEELADRLGLGDISLSARGFQNGEYAVEFPGGNETTCFTLTKMRADDEYVALIERGEGDRLPLFPADAELRKMADEYLRRLGLETRLEWTKIFVQEAIETAGAGTALVTHELSKGVAYRVMIDGFPLIGPGAKVYVTFGPRGELLRVVHWVMPHKKGPDVRIRPTDDAAADIAAGKGLPPGTFTPVSARETKVTGVSLAYWAEPLPLQEKYYKPVYVFSVVDGEGRSGSWVVPALDAKSD